MNLLEKLENGHVTEDDLRALRDPSVECRYSVLGGRRYVELLAVDGERIVAIDSMCHPFSEDIEEFQSEHPQDRIVRNFFDKQTAWMSRT